MKTRPYALFLVLVSSSCSSDSSTPPAAKDAGHEAQAPGTEGGADCVALQTNLFVALEQAAKCQPSDGGTECSGKAIVKDRCGCDTVVSDAYKDLAGAQQASEAYRTQCGTPGCSGMQCGAATASAICRNLNDGRGPICIWSN